MSHEWKFNPRPYSDEEAKTLLKDVVSPETTDWHYNTHHKGYVTFLNNIEKALEASDRSKANGNYSEIGELKRRFTWNHSGALLHDLYWEVLGGDGDISRGPDIVKAIESNFGSIDLWKADFESLAVAAKLSGWGFCSFLINYIREDCLMFWSMNINTVLSGEEFLLSHAMCSNMHITIKMVRAELNTLIIL